MKDPLITISYSQLRQAMLTWGHQYRAGLTRQAAEVLAQPVELTADESTEHLWNLLKNPVKLG